MLSGTSESARGHQLTDKEGTRRSWSENLSDLAVTVTVTVTVIASACWRKPEANSIHSDRSCRVGASSELYKGRAGASSHPRAIHTVAVSSRASRAGDGTPQRPLPLSSDPWRSRLGRGGAQQHSWFGTPTPRRRRAGAYPERQPLGLGPRGRDPPPPSPRFPDSDRPPRPCQGRGTQSLNGAPPWGMAGA